MASLALTGSRAATARAPDGTASSSSRRVPWSMAAPASASVSNSRMSTASPASASAG